MGRHRIGRVGRWFTNLLILAKNAKNNNSADHSPSQTVTNTKLTSLRQRLYEGRLDAERNYRYYGKKADTYRLWYTGLVFTIGAGSLSTALLVGVKLGDFELVLIPPFIASLATLVLITFDIPGRTSRAENAKRFYMTLNNEWRDLWWKHHPDFQAPEIRDDTHMLEIREHAFIDTGISLDEKLGKKCQKQAEKIILAEYTYKEGSSG